jgi:5S rRNA maturation endonuclease (ribonuclease M5)
VIFGHVVTVQNSRIRGLGFEFVPLLRLLKFITNVIEKHETVKVYVFPDFDEITKEIAKLFTESTWFLSIEEILEKVPQEAQVREATDNMLKMGLLEVNENKSKMNLTSRGLWAFK